MDDKQFGELLQSVGDMGRHMRGHAVAGAKVREFPEPDVKAIRECTGLSQTRFAYLIGVKPKTLQLRRLGCLATQHGAAREIVGLLVQPNLRENWLDWMPNRPLAL